MGTEELGGKMQTIGYLVYKEGDGLIAYRRTEEEANKHAEFLLDVDPEAEFTIKTWTQEWV